MDQANDIFSFAEDTALAFPRSAEDQPRPHLRALTTALALEVSEGETVPDNLDQAVATRRLPRSLPGVRRRSTR